MLWRALGSPARVRMGVKSDRSPIALIAKIASFLVTGDSLSVATTSVGQHRAIRRELLEELLAEFAAPWAEGSASVIQAGMERSGLAWSRPLESAMTVPGPASVSLA